jgi:anti-anti-sigma factor
MKQSPSPGDKNPRSGPPAPEALALPTPLFGPAGYALASATTQKELLDGLNRIVAGRGADCYHLSRFDNDKGEIELVAAWDVRGESPFPLGMRAPRAGYPIVDLLSVDAPVLLDDCASDPRLSEEVKQMLAQSGLRALGIYPLIRQGELAGFLSIQHLTPHEHANEEVHFFSLVAMLASTALTGIERGERLAQQIKRANAMHVAAKTLGGLEGEEAVLETAAKLLVTELGFVDCWMGMVDEEAGVLREVAAAGVASYPGRVPMVFSLTDAGRAGVDVLHSHKPIIMRDVLERADAEGWGAIARAASMRDVVVLPLRAGNKTLGSIGVSQAHVAITDDEVTMLDTFASQLAGTILRARADAERQAQVEALEAAYAAQARLLETVRELSTPVIPVYDGVLVLPLVGTLDSSRSAELTEALLDAIQRDRASVVIIDVTGVPTIDTSVASHLLRSTSAARLLGAKSVVVGISPVVAQTLVQLGVDLSSIVTRNNLQAGISYALARLNLEIRPIEEPRRY